MDGQRSTLTSNGPNWGPREAPAPPPSVARVVRSIGRRVDLILEECDMSNVDLPFSSVKDHLDEDEGEDEEEESIGMVTSSEHYGPRYAPLPRQPVVVAEKDVVPRSSALLRTTLPPSLSGNPDAPVSRAAKRASRMALPRELEVNSFLTSAANPFAYVDNLARVPDSYLPNDPRTEAFGAGQENEEEDGDDDEAIAEWRAAMAVEAQKLNARDPFHPDWKPLSASSPAAAHAALRAVPSLYDNYTTYLRNELS